MATNIHDLSVTDASVALYGYKAQAILGTTVATNWTVVSSGTGTAGTWVASGDLITAASKLLVANAWFVLQGKGVVDGGTTYKRQLCWQVDGAGLVRCKVSPRAGFTNVASASATRVPSATDERVLLGGGTDASPTFEALFPTSGAWMQAEFSEADDSFWCMTYPVGGAAANSMLVLGVTPLLYDTSGGLYDKDPAVYYARSGVTAALASSWASEQYGPLGLLAYLSSGGTDDAWVRLPAALRATYDTSAALQPVLPGHLPQSPAFPSGPVYAQDTLRCGRRSELAGTSTGLHESGNLNTCGDKGEEYYLRFSGHLFTVPTLLDSVSPTTGLTVTGSLIGIGNVVLPWTLAESLRDGA